jgi:hypothetical protein
MILAEFGTGQVVWSLLWLSLFFLWWWVVIVVFAEIIGSKSLSGWGKALWSAFIIFVPYLGVLVYFVVKRGEVGA